MTIDKSINASYWQCYYIVMSREICLIICSWNFFEVLSLSNNVVNRCVAIGSLGYDVNKSRCIRDLVEYTGHIFRNVTYLGYELYSEMLELRVTPVLMKSTIFQYIMPCCPLKVIRRFGGIYHFHIQGRIKRGRYQSEIRKIHGTHFC
jgi:hypothetical protein